MEHIVLRDGDLNSTEIIRVSSTGAFAQARIGRSPFALNSDGVPRDLRAGDVLWVAQTGYGVVGKARVAELSPVESIGSLEDIEKLRRQHAGLAATYWDELRDRLARAREKYQDLKFVMVHYDQGENLSTTEQFRLARDRGDRNSWITLRNDEKKAKVFRNKGTTVSATLLEEDAGGDYGTITDKIRWAVIQVWKTRCAGVKAAENEPCEFDHHVPRALGGPGVLLENVIPLPKSLNRAKSHRVPVSFPTVALRWGLLSDRERSGWGDPMAEGSARRQQEQLTKRVTAAVRKLSVNDQRRFYFEVLEAGLGGYVRSYFEEAGVQVPPAV